MRNPNASRFAVLLLLCASFAPLAAQDLSAGDFEARRGELRARYLAATTAQEKAAVLLLFQGLKLAQGQDLAGSDPGTGLLEDLLGGLGAVAGGGSGGQATPADTGLGATPVNNLNGNQPPAPTPTPTPAANDPFEPIAVELRKFPIGRAALATKDATSLRVTFVGDRPAIAVCDFATGSVEVRMKPGVHPVTGALYFVHEIHHVRMFLSGATADPRKVDQDTYVELMVREESDGTCQSIRGRMEYETAIGARANVPLFPAEGEYRWAYRITIEAGRSVEEAHYGATEHVFFVFRWLQTYGPNQFEGYPTYYRRDWRKANP